MERDRFFVRQIGDRWTFGREGTAFETFATKELAVERARSFERQHPDVEITIEDAVPPKAQKRG